MDAWFAQTLALIGLDALFVKPYLAVLLVCGTCGAVGSLVVGNRMAFFSDALAHCAFAGVALGLLGAMVTVGGRLDRAEQADFIEWLVPGVMAILGVVVGLLIARVRESTALASDTVIGVFFAGAIGLGAILMPVLSRVSKARFNPEALLFGSVTFVSVADILLLAVLAALTAGLLTVWYNEFVFASVNPSLARSRRVRVRLVNAGFVVLLSLIVFLSIRAVGALLINALLIVPAATASNLSRNLRHYFWLTLALSVGAGVVGTALSTMPVPLGDKVAPLDYGAGGLIVVLSVLLFLASLALRKRTVG